MLPKARRACRLAGEVPLAGKLRSLKPEAVVVVMKGIKKNVERAMTAARCSAPSFFLSFPSHGHDREYVFELSKIVKQLAKAPRK